MKKNIEYYMSLPYQVNIHREPDGTYVGSVVEFDVCMSEGKTISELMKNIEEAKYLWIEATMDSGVTIPEPGDKEYSGSFLVRLPKTLHRELVRNAKKEGVSLNQYVAYQLSHRPAQTKQSKKVMLQR